jgi:phosphinothricin acetyltransferase
VSETNQTVTGWVALSPVTSRCVYAGVAEVSIYVAKSQRGKGVGRALMSALVVRSEELGFWTLQSQMFADNRATVDLHLSHGFRQVGLREKIGKMTYGPYAGQWRDTLFFERRSVVVGI